MFTRFNILFASAVFILAFFLSAALFGDDGVLESIALKESVDRIHTLEDKRREELSFLRDSAEVSYPQSSGEGALVVSFEGDVYHPIVEDYSDLEPEYKPLSKTGSLFIGAAASALYLLIVSAVRWLSGRRRK